MTWAEVKFNSNVVIGTWITRAELAELRRTSSLDGIPVKSFKHFKEKKYEEEKN